MSHSPRLQELPPVARSISLECPHCGAERYFKVIAHLSDVAAKAKCEVCGRAKTLRVGDTRTGGFVSEGKTDSKVADSTKAAKGEKTKKPRNTAGLLAAAEKRRLANAEKKADAAARKDAEGRSEYTKQYESLKGQIGTAGVQPYGMKAKFPVAAAIQHPTFGLGFVTVATGDRIEVAFESGVRQLIHNRQ